MVKSVLSISLFTSMVLATSSYYHQGSKTTLEPIVFKKSADSSLAYYKRGSQVVGVRGEIIVKLGEKSVEEVTNKYGISFVKNLTSTMVLFSADSPQKAIEISAKIYEDGYGVFAHPNFVEKKKSREYKVPTDPLYSKSWHLGDTDTIKDAHINVLGAWQSVGGEGVTVAVYDDAVLTTHEDLSENISEALDFTISNKDASPQSADDTHGTFVAGLAMAASNDKGSLGVAPKAKLMAIRGATGGASEADHINVFNHVKNNNVAVMNNSWGGYNVSDGLREAIIDLVANGRDGKGTVVIFAYGNDACNDLANEQCKKDGTGEEQGYLANDESSVEGVYTVVALNQKNQKSSYSNWGTKADIAAPGGDGDDILENKAGIVSTININTTESSYAVDDPDQVGTSYAAPIVAGVVALVASVNPDLTSKEIMEVINSTADKVGGYEYDSSGRSNYTGYGKINATKAVEKANSMRSDGGLVTTTTTTEESSSSSSSSTVSGFDYGFENRSGWNLLGAVEELGDIKTQHSLDIVWTYSEGKWEQNPATIKKGDGFWIKK